MKNCYSEKVAGKKKEIVTRGNEKSTEISVFKKYFTEYRYVCFVV